MSRFTKTLWALALLATAWGLPNLPALAADSCRQAVVIYLDVSGSMYGPNYVSESPWSNGKPLTLMENTVRFLEKSLLAPGSLAVHPGDSVILRGFYSKVSPLGNTMDNFLPERDAPRLGRIIDQKLDINKLHRYDLSNARGGTKGKPNPFLLRQDEAVTDFLGVLQDMMQIYRDTPLESGSAQSFNKLVFYVLTDGGHDNERTWEQYKQKVQEAQALMRDKQARGRVRVHLFSVMAADHGAFRDLDPRHDISQDFEKGLGAKRQELDMSRVNQAWFNAYLASLTERIEIVGAGPARYEYPQAPRPGEPRREGPAVGKIVAPLTLENRSCQALALEKVQCAVLQAPDPAGLTAPTQGGKELKDRRPLAVNLTIPGNGSGSNISKKEISYDLALQPGRYQLELTPISQGLGAGQGPAAVLDLQVPQPTPPPTNLNLYFLVGFLCLAAAGGLVWILYRSIRGRRS